MILHAPDITISLVPIWALLFSQVVRRPIEVLNHEDGTREKRKVETRGEEREKEVDTYMTRIIFVKKD